MSMTRSAVVILVIESFYLTECNSFASGVVVQEERMIKEEVTSSKYQRHCARQEILPPAPALPGLWWVEIGCILVPLPVPRVESDSYL